MEETETLPLIGVFDRISAFICKTLPHDNVPYPPPRRLHGMSRNARHLPETCWEWFIPEGFLECGDI